MLIVFYNSMWGQALPAREELPPECEVSADRSRMHEADAVVLHLPSLRFWERPKKRKGQIWVAWSIESEEHCPLLTDEGVRARFDLTMSYRRDADVIWGYVPYYSSASNLERALASPPRLKDSERPVAMLISSRADRSGRRALAQDLMRHIAVDSYGTFLRNKTIAQDQWRPSKLELIARYPFTLAFENSISDDYVTEKFFDPLVAGSVPVYLGAKNVDEFAPGENCYIDAARFDSPQALADHLKGLHRDPEAYAALLAWKDRPLRQGFREWLNRQRTPPIWRLHEAVRAARRDLP